MKKFLYVLICFILVSLQYNAYSQGPYTITASAGTGGTITPSGAVIVTENTDQSFIITAKSGFQIDVVTVDGSPVGNPANFTFSSVTAGHTISVTFAVTSHLALNKPASAEDTEPGNSPSFANDADGSNNKFWSGTQYPKWWKVDLQGFFDLTSIVIRNYVDGTRFYHYNIEASNDDITYTQIAAKTDDNAAPEDGDTYPVTATARFLRVNIIFNSVNLGTHITDFRVYGTANPNTNIITSNAGAGGTITPQGSDIVLKNTDKTFTIVPNTGFVISDVLVDGLSVGAVSTYTFTNIILDHSIAATFLSTTRTIAVTGSTGGTISPSGSVIAALNSNQSFNISAKSGFQISDVKVDGVSQGPLTTYTFNNVTTNHTLSATFTVTSHLALNKPASAEDIDGGNLPSYANDTDGSNNNFWSGTIYPKWWKVDLQDIYNITSIVIRNYVDGVRYYQYNIEVSNDDVTYTKIAEKTNTNPATDDGDSYTLNSSGRYLRVNITNNSANPGTHICDFRVYGTKGLTITGVTANNKVYDGSNIATLNIAGAALSGVATGDVVTLITSGASGTFADKNKGSAKPVTISGFTLGGTDAGKYTLSQPSATADITPENLTVGGSFSVSNKTYDATTDAIISVNNLNLITKAAGDDVNLHAVAVFPDKNAGSAKPVTLTGSSLTGVDAPNYNLSLTGAPASTADISAMGLSIGGSFAVSNKVYDGTTEGAISGNSLTLLTKVGSDDVSLSPVAVFATKVVGSANTVSLTGSSLTGVDAPNYNLSLTGAPTTTAEITSRVLTIGGIFTVNNKVYDGTVSADISTNSLTLLTKAAGDDVSLTAVAVFSSRSAGAGNHVSLTGSSLSGADASNYTLSLTGAPAANADIASKVLTIGGTFVTGNKVYDGTTAASISTNNLTLNTIVTGDDINLVANALFSSKSVGTGNPVSLTGSSLTGADAVNYTLSLAGAPTSTADITTRGLTIAGTFTTNNKVYDGTNAATISANSLSLVTKAPGDDVSLAPVAVFSSKSAGTDKPVSLDGSALTGSDAPNYILSLTGSPSSTANITSKIITIGGSFAVSNKIYDGTTSATISTNNLTIVDITTGDDVSLAASAVFSSKSAGTANPVNLAGSTLAGTDASNYTLSFTGAPATTADVASRVLTIGGTFGAAGKVYDGSASAVISSNSLTLITKAAGDDVNLVPAALFSLKSAGSGNPVSLTGSSLTGTDSPNYTLSLTGAPTTTADISPKVLTIGGLFSVNDKAYDGTTSATILTENLFLITKEAGDNVTLTPVVVFSDKNVGVGITVNLTGSSLSGNDAFNYILSLTGAPVTTGSINSSGLIITGITANSKVYDGNTIADLNSGSAALSGVIAGDIVTLVTSGASGVFDNKNSGTGKTITTSGFILNGADAGKYTLVQPVITASITSKPVTITGIKANNKVYDGITVASLNTTSASLNGIVPGDIVTVNLSAVTGSFSNKNAGVGKTVTISGFSLSGSDAANYSPAQPTTQADITSAVLSVTGATADSKIYDGTAAATINSTGAFLTGIIAGDDVSLISSGTTGTFADKNAGIAKAVTITGFAAGGADALNYTLAQPTQSAVIFPKTLTITANNSSKTYGSAIVFSGSEYTVAGLVSGDAVNGIVIVSQGAAASAQTGIYDIVVSEGSDTNYNIANVSGKLTVNKAALTATADSKTKVYGTSNPIFSISYSGLKNGDSPAVLDEPPLASSTAGAASNTGSYPISLSGGSDNNYSLTLVNGNMVITKVPLTITADNKTRTFGQANPTLTISYIGFVLGQDQTVLDIPPAIGTSAGANSDAGSYNITVSGAADVNYSFFYNNGLLTINKADQSILFDPLPAGLRMTQEQQLSATSASGLPVAFETSDPDIGTVDGNLLTIKKDGNLTIIATQQGNQNWNPAAAVTQSIAALPSFDNIMSLFTPNSDGINDLWYIPSIEQYGKIQVTVYNRYGKIVFQSDGYKNDWDGTWNGNPLPSASYYYLIKSSEKETSRVL